MKAWTKTALCLLGVLLPVALLLGCDERSGGPTDFIAPELDLFFPTGTSYDADGDGLMDVVVTFEGETADVNPGETRVRVDGIDVLDGWTVTRSDSTGFAAEETLAGLLSSGEHLIEVIVEDRAGNVKSANLRLELPVGAIHRVMDVPNGGDPFQRVRNLEMGPDGKRLYVVASTAELIVVDPDAYKIVARTPSPIGDLRDVKGDWARGRLYAVSFLHPGLVEFDAATGQALRTLPTTQGAFTLAVSRQRQEVYVPLEVEFSDVDGLLSVVDMAAGREVEVIDSGVRNEINPSGVLAQRAAILSEDGTYLYVPNAQNQGVLVYDVAQRAFLRQIDINPFEPERLGSALGATRVGSFLFLVGRESGYPHANGIAFRVDLGTNQTLRRVLGNGWDVNGIVASPDGQTLFVVGKSGGRLPHLAPGNYLLDAASFQLRGTLPDVEPDDPYYGYTSAAWHPDGKRVYVTSTDNYGKDQITVYVVRPQ